MGNIAAMVQMWAAGNRLFMLALWRGEAARPQVPTSGDGLEYLTWCFEFGLQSKPVLDAVDGVARPILMGYLLTVLKQMLGDLIAGLGKGK